MYSPAPSPFGNMVGGGGVGTANLSHTSTAMLVPMHSQAGPHSVILGPGGGPPQMGRMKRPFRTITPPTLSPFVTPTNNGSICVLPCWLLTGFRPSLFLCAFTGAYIGGPGMGTLPRYGGHMAGPPPTFLTGSIIGPICSNPGPTSAVGGGGVLSTLSRQSMMMDGTIPRSLSRGTTENSQFYYG